MSLDFEFITNLVREGRPGLKLVRDKGIRDEMLEGPDVIKIFKYIQTFNSEFGETPSEKTVVKHFGSEFFVEPEQGLSYTLDRLMKRHGFKITATAANQINDVIASDDSEDLLNVVEKTSDILIKASKRLILETGSSHTADVTKNTKERIISYNERKELDGITGIPSYWPFLTNMTRGFQRGQTYLFLAQEGTGKTFNLILQGIAAMLAGYKPIFFTEEMSHAEIANRFDALKAGVDYDGILRGNLSPEQHEKWLKHLEELEAGKFEFFINEGGGKAGIDSVFEIAQETGAEIIFLDNVYLYAPSLEPKLLAELSSNLKRGAKLLNMPLVMTTQINEGGGSFWSKSFGHDASFRWVIEMPEGQEDKRIIRSSKTRDSRAQTAVINWDPTIPNYELDEQMTKLFSVGGAIQDTIEGVL